MDILHSPFWILLAKCILALIMAAVGLASLFVLRKANDWRATLAIMQTECDVLRDETMLQGVLIRSRLADIQEKLRKKPEKAEMEVIGNLVKEAMPVISFFMAKEKNLFKWGFAGAKLLRGAYEYFSRKK